MIHVFKIHVSILFVLSLENNWHKKILRRYFLANVEVKDYSVMVDGTNIFDHSLKNDSGTYENIEEIATD